VEDGVRFALNCAQRLRAAAIASRAAKSLAERPKAAQPSHHSDIQVTHDHRHDPAGKTDLHRGLRRDAFHFPLEQNEAREQTKRRSISGELRRVEGTNAYDHAT
jgi:hypothetical protein